MQVQQNALGLTSIRELELAPEIMRDYRDLERAGKLTLRVSMGQEARLDDTGRLEESLKAWGVGPGEVVVGHLANNSREKGTVDLLRAAGRAGSLGCRFHLVLAGPEMPNFRAFWRSYGSAVRVLRLGVLDDGQKRDFYVRQLWDQKGSADIEMMSPARFVAYAQMCGWTLARAHARSGDRIAIGAYLGKGDTFDRAMSAFAEAYADQSERDYAALKHAADVGTISVAEMPV